MTQTRIQKQVADCIDQPTERLQERVLAGVDFGIKALKRLRRRLPKWLRPAGKPDAARCIAATAAIDTALSLISPMHLRDRARRFRKQMEANN